LELGAAGLNPTEIGRLTGIPRATVRDWIAGLVPRSSRSDSCPTCGHRGHRWDALPRSYVYLLGVYLGDGCLSPHPRGVFKLRISLDTRYPGILYEVEQAIRDVSLSNPVGQCAHPGCVEIYSYSKAWPCLFPQHGAGKKHERQIKLAEWQQSLVERHPKLFLRGLIHSDGCRFINTGSGGWRCPRYGFSNLSADIHGLFRDACEQLDLHWTAARKKQTYVSRKADVARMDEFIGPKA
jgi:hypothetical protein